MTTRLGLGGFSRSPYGSFAGKAAVISGAKTTLLENVTLSATGSVAVTGNKTTTLGTTLGASGSVFISGTKTTLLDSVLLSAVGTNGSVAPGCGLTPEQVTTIETTLSLVREIHTRLGLEQGNAWTDTPTQSGDAGGGIVIDNTGDGETSSTGTRQ